MSISIGGRGIGPNGPPFVIAEMSGNHNRSLDRALEIVDAAAAAGAHALKLQTYTADTITLDVDAPGFVVEDPKSPWAGRRLHDLYDDAHTPWEWHEAIFARARDAGLLCFSSPFDATAVDLLEGLGAPAYKIASFEIVDIPLVRRVAATGMPVIVSTGMASVAEIDDAVRAIRAEGNEQIVLLKCTSSYPASPADSNIRTIPHLRELFGCEVGLSDHTMGSGVATAAVALGASVVEKHFTLSRDDGGVDAAFSMEPSELHSLVTETARAWESIGAVSYGPTQHERGSLQFRRSLYIARDMAAGDVFDARNVRSVRPGFGLPPALIDVVLGRRVTRDATNGTPLTWDLVG